MADGGIHPNQSTAGGRERCTEHAPGRMEEKPDVSGWQTTSATRCMICFDTFRVVMQALNRLEHSFSNRLQSSSTRGVGPTASLERGLRMDLQTPSSILQAPISFKLLCIGLVSFVCWRAVVGLLRPRVSLPPGPPGELLIGHYRKIPFEADFKQYNAWSKEYSRSHLISNLILLQAYHLKCTRVRCPLF